MAFSLSTLFGNLGVTLGNMIHLRKNELGHSALGNQAVSVIDNVLDPVAGAVASNATGGLLNLTTSAPPSTAGQLSTDDVIAALLQAIVNSHVQSTTALTPSPNPPVASTQPTTSTATPASASQAAINAAADAPLAPDPTQ